MATSHFPQNGVATLHLVGHHLLDHSGYQRSQCHYCRVAGQVAFAYALEVAYPDANRHHYNNVQH